MFFYFFLKSKHFNVIRAKRTYLLYFTFLFLILGCEKESDPYEPAFVEGVVLDRVTDLPVPYAKVTLYELEPHERPWFVFWDPIAVQTAGSDGFFRFDYQGEETNLYGLKTDQMGYYEEEEINQFFRIDVTEKNVYPLPKSYMKIRMVDESPFLLFDSVWINGTTYAPITRLFSHFSDTTVVIPVTPEIAGSVLLTFWNDGQRTDLLDNASCTAHDTCSVIYRY